MRGKSLTANVFSLFFQRNAKQGSTLTVGGVDGNHYTGAFTFTAVTEYSYVRYLYLF